MHKIRYRTCKICLNYLYSVIMIMIGIFFLQIRNKNWTQTIKIFLLAKLSLKSDCALCYTLCHVTFSPLSSCTWETSCTWTIAVAFSFMTQFLIVLIVIFTSYCYSKTSSWSFIFPPKNFIFPHLSCKYCLILK